MTDKLWTGNVTAATYADGNTQLYQAAILEQYKLYVEMADRTSARRIVTNSFFLTLNTAILAAIGALWESDASFGGATLLLPLGALLAECVMWFIIIRAYRLLNAAKFVVIGELEQRLPASPYWHGEWAALGYGEDHSKYQPVTFSEQVVPVLFALVYVGTFLAAVS